MAMRPRRGGSFQPRPPMRPTYESFRPRVEWKHEENASILILQLPGFVKEQIRIDIVESNGLMQIQGQRPIGTGRWSAFNQSFVLPSACDWTQISTEFGLGVLTIIMPNKIPLTRPTSPTTTTTTTIPPPQDDRKVALPDEITTSKASIDTGKQPDHHQERVEPIVDDKKWDDADEKTEAISSDDDHKLPKLEKFDGKKEEKDHKLKKGEAEEKAKAKNREHESDVVEKETVKNEEQACLINMVIAALVLMGLGAHIYSIIGSSKTA